MRNLIIIADSDPRCKVVGGVGTYASHLARELSASYDVLFVGKQQREEPDGILPYDVVLANTKPGQSNIGFLWGLVHLTRTIRTTSETIIHAQRPDWLWAFRGKPGRKVVTLHGSHAKNMMLKKGWLLRTLYGLLERRGLALADAIIAVDKRTAEEFKQQYPAFADKIVVHPVGVDTDLFVLGNKRELRKKLGLPVAARIFLYVGRLSKEKNIDQMIRQLGEHELLVIVGLGEQEAHLVDLAEGKNVLFAGAKRQEELVDYYAAADALLLFSSHEGLPTVVLEAFACGLPVVATSVGELPSLIKPGKNGYLVRKKNHRKCMDDVLKRNEIMRRECRKAALAYDWGTVSKAIAKEVYTR